MQTSGAMRREKAKSYSVRSPDERSEIRDHSDTAPDIASLIRATGFARNDVERAGYDDQALPIPENTP
jgi:hypothetical protein